MGIMTTIFVIMIPIIFITISGIGAQGKSEFSGTVSHPKVQTLSNRAPNLAMEGGRADPTKDNHRGEGGDTSICICIYVYTCEYVRIRVYMVGRLVFPPLSNGMVWWGREGGGWHVWRGDRGRWSCSWSGVTARARIVHKPYASHKTLKRSAAARAPVTLTCSLNPTPNSKPRPNAGSSA